MKTASLQTTRMAPTYEPSAASPLRHRGTKRLPSPRFPPLKSDVKAARISTKGWRKCQRADARAQKENLVFRSVFGEEVAAPSRHCDHHSWLQEQIDASEETLHEYELCIEGLGYHYETAFEKAFDLVRANSHLLEEGSALKVDLERRYDYNSYRVDIDTEDFLGYLRQQKGRIDTFIEDARYFDADDFVAETADIRSRFRQQNAIIDRNLPAIARQKTLSRICRLDTTFRELQSYNTKEGHFFDNQHDALMIALDPYYDLSEWVQEQIEYYERLLADSASVKEGVAAAQDLRPLLEEMKRLCDSVEERTDYRRSCANDGTWTILEELQRVKGRSDALAEILDGFTKVYFEEEVAGYSDLLASFHHESAHLDEQVAYYEDLLEELAGR